MTSVTERVTSLLRSSNTALPPPPRRRALRVSANLTLRQLADAIEVSPQAVHHWESGDRMPRGPHLVAYAEALAVLEQAQRVCA